jgi:hypothetical protein
MDMVAYGTIAEAIHTSNKDQTAYHKGHAQRLLLQQLDDWCLLEVEGSLTFGGSGSSCILISSLSSSFAESPPMGCGVVGFSAVSLHIG